MGPGNLAYLYISIALVYKVASLELLANYKFWKSSTEQLTYDYSGNSRHGSLFDLYIVTDRGLSGKNYYELGAMAYKNPGLTDYTFSYWAHNIDGQGDFELNPYQDSGESIIYKSTFNLGYVVYMLANIISTEEKYHTIDVFTGWNLHTVRVYLDSTDTYKINFEIYLNLVPILSQFIGTDAPYTKLDKFLFKGLDSINLNSLLYEMWIHTKLSNISDLSSIFSTFSCPSSINTVCLPTYDRTINFLGTSCPGSCINSSLSCDKNLNCILRGKTECPYGLYDMETSECLFYCPYNSCICPTATATVYAYLTSFSCSCNLGYKMISDNPPACISNNCLAYHRVNYSYICDTIESGYDLDVSGGCCVCKSGITQVSTTPLICVNTAICINHIVSGVDYICSECATGYIIDAYGKCNQCDVNYVSVLSNPFTCIIKIENCKNFNYDGTQLICIECNEGYSIGNSGLECILLNCLAYIIQEDIVICTECMNGYQTGTDGKCSLCEDNYASILVDPLICAPYIDNCSSYELFGKDYICKECSIGYTLGSSGLCDECGEGYLLIESENILCKPDISYCLEYDESKSSLECTKCENGYKLDSQNKCTLCEEGYIQLPFDDSICITQALHCSEYGLIQNNWVCRSCGLGYELDEDMLCNKCSEGYTYSGLECILQGFDIEDEQEEDTTEIHTQQAELIENSNSISATAVMTSTSVSSIVSKDPNSLILFINTIQLISLIQYLNIPLSLEIKKQQSSNNDFINRINILQYLKIQDQDLKEYIGSCSNGEYSFIASTIYQIILLCILLIINAIIYSLSRYARGKLQEIGKKIMRYFKYTIYLHFYMITYIDISYNSIHKLVTPNDSSAGSILDYEVALIFAVIIIKTLSVTSPFLLASLIKSIKLSPDTEACYETYGVLIKAYKETIICVYYHVLFLMRRLIIVGSTHLLDKVPYIQVCICSVSCLAVSFIVGIHTYDFYKTFSR